ncbi:GntR family transcriptional regulator [Micromonospora cathayae]|uniref:GntR family transcriptional regulator n=1 Tax=Micromonospora cathayae TaxID=3028804 RepID=A0ABY7ZRV3_9ACTN|nr:GntR family transcriptional regulator [Micromonospora sp. HUAS 3]WDZ85203.1 GntR family transcriptional regulator [Micromonospora sp. HUAS 3]
MRIDPRSHTPVYIQLADLLREQIESGKVPPGSVLASETRLSQEHGIGRESVRMAVAILRSEGLVSTSRGRGTWVREVPQRDEVELTPGGSAIARMPSSHERREMDLDEGVPVLEIRDAAGDVQVLPADKAQIIRPTSD